jgi:SulP family sulfate permease
VRDYGLQYLLAASILAGVLQLLAGALRLGVLMRFVSRSVMTGFVNALAILIFMAQLPELIGVTPVTYVMVAVGLGIIYLLPRLTTAVPSPLIAIVASCPRTCRPSCCRMCRGRWRRCGSSCRSPPPWRWSGCSNR